MSDSDNYRLGKAVLPIILAADFLSRLLVLIRSLKYIDGLIVPDDAYYTFSLAKSIASGLGPLYTVDYTNGFQPLYVFLIMPFFKLFPNDLIIPIHLSLLLLAVFDVLSVYFLYRLVILITRSPIAALPVSALWIFNPYVIETSMNGLETIISFFMILSTIYYYQKNFYSAAGSITPGKREFILGAMLGLAMLARVDNSILAFSVVAVYLVCAMQNKLPARTLLKGSTLIVLGGFLIYLPWLVYSYHYTGGFYQGSGPALRYIHLANIGPHPSFHDKYGVILIWAILTVGRNNIVCLSLITILAIYYLIRVRRESLYRQAARPVIAKILGLFGILLFSIYSFYIFGPWYMSRYLFPLVLPFSLLLAVIIELYNRSLPKKSVRIFFNTIVITAIISANALQPKFISYYLSTDSSSFGYMNTGLWAKNHFPDGTRIGASQSGALGYFADNLVVFNLVGVGNRKAYESLIEKRHMDYIRQNKIEYLMGWPVNIEAIKNRSAGYSSEDLIPMGAIRGFKSWEAEWLLYRVNYDDDE